MIKDEMTDEGGNEEPTRIAVKKIMRAFGPSFQARGVGLAMFGCIM